MGDDINADAKAKENKKKKTKHGFYSTEDLAGQLVSSQHIDVPQERFERFLERCKAEAGEDATNEFLGLLKETDFEPLKKILFHGELGISNRFNFPRLRFVNPFDRGKADLAWCQRHEKTLEDRNDVKIKITREFLSGFAAPVIDEIKPKKIAEIGGAWCATLGFFAERYAPDTYYNFEIDQVYAEYSQERYGAIPMKADGETLYGVPSGEMDLVVANNVLFFSPLLKTYSYFKEMDRVLRKGGMVLFNVILMESVSEKYLDFVLEDRFPNRMLNFMPQHMLDIAFPESKYKLRNVETQNHREHLGQISTTYIYEKLTD